MLLELGMTLTTLLGKYFLLRDYPGNPEGVVRDTRVSLLTLPYLYFDIQFLKIPHRPLPYWEHLIIGACVKIVHMI